MPQFGFQCMGKRNLLVDKKEISVEQSYAILDYVKRKIAQDTKVGELVKISYEDFL